MGRFHIYGHNDIPDGILENIKSNQFITSTSVTLSPSRHILWEVMFGRYSTCLFYKPELNSIPEKILVTSFEEAMGCLEKFASLKNNPFVIPKIMSHVDMQYMVTQFVRHLYQKIAGGYILYNITEVMNTYYVAQKDTEFLTAIALSKDFYTKILSEQPFVYREALYALSGTPFRFGMTDSSLISCIVENPTATDFYNMIAGIEDM